MKQVLATNIYFFSLILEPGSLIRRQSSAERPEMDFVICSCHLVENKHGPQN